MSSPSPERVSATRIGPTGRSRDPMPSANQPVMSTRTSASASDVTHTRPGRVERRERGVRDHLAGAVVHRRGAGGAGRGREDREVAGAAGGDGGEREHGGRGRRRHAVAAGHLDDGCAAGRRAGVIRRCRCGCRAVARVRPPRATTPRARRRFGGRRRRRRNSGRSERSSGRSAAVCSSWAAAVVQRSCRGGRGRNGGRNGRHRWGPSWWSSSWSSSLPSAPATARRVPAHRGVRGEAGGRGQPAGRSTVRL